MSPELFHEHYCLRLWFISVIDCEENNVMVWTSQNFSVPCTGTAFLSGLKECLVYLAFVIHEKINKQALAVLIFPPFINTSSWYVLPAAKPSKFALSFTDKMKQLFPVMNNWVGPHYLQSGCRCQPAAHLQPPSPCYCGLPFWELLPGTAQKPGRGGGWMHCFHS